MKKAGAAIISIFLASLISLVGFLFILAGPVWVFMLVFGKGSVEGAPGNGAAFVFWAGPVAAVATFYWVIRLSFRFYDRFSKQSHSDSNDRLFKHSDSISSK
jgi:hypothetical protein